MASYNRVVLVGNITRDIELKYTQGGMAVADIGIAVNEKRKDANGEQAEETTFVDVTLFGRTAEVAAEYLRKGSPALIEGRLKQDKWQDKNTGENRFKLKVVGERLQLLPTGQQRRGGNESPANEPPANEDDIPY